MNASYHAYPIRDILQNSALKKLVIKGRITKCNVDWYNYCPADNNLQTVDLSQSKLKAVGNLRNLKKLTTVLLPSSLEEIGYEAFENSGLESIKIPGKVKTVGYHALNCPNLKSISFETFTEAKFGKDAFGSVYTSLLETLPRPLLSDDGKAIYLLPKESSVVIPEGVMYICSGLEAASGIQSLTLPSTLKYIAPQTFYNCYIRQVPDFPASLDFVGYQAFSFNETVVTPGGVLVSTPRDEEVYVIPDGVKIISGNAFYNKPNTLKAVSMPACVERIDAYAFSKSRIEGIIIPPSVKSIGISAFAECQKLKYAVLPDELKSIPERAFYNCTGLTHVNVPTQIASIGERAFYGVPMSGTFVAGANLGSIGDYAFDNTKLSGLSIEDGVVLHIGIRSFGSYNTYSSTPISYAIKSVYLNRKEVTSATPIPVDSVVTYGPAVKYLTARLFAGNVKSVVVPETVDSIEVGAFSNYPKLEELTLPFIGCNRKPAPQTAFATPDEEVAFYNKYFFGSIFGTTRSSKSYDAGFYGDSYFASIYTFNIPSTLKRVVFVGESLNKWKWYPIKRIIVSASSSYGSYTEYKQDAEVLANIDLYIPNASAKLFDADTPKEWKVPSVITVLPEDDSRYNKEYYWSNDYANNDVYTGFTTYLKMFKDVDFSALTALPENLLAQASRLSRVVLPFAGAGTKDTYTHMGTLFATASADGLAKASYTNESGTVTDYYVPNSLREIAIAEGCTKIPYAAFSNFTMLEKVTLPTTTTLVAEKAFYNCAGVTTLEIKKALPPVAYESSFEGCSQFGCVLQVPSGSKQYYSVANGWKYFYFMEEEAPIAITVSKNIEHAGEINGALKYKRGETAQLIAAAHQGYEFVGWYMDNDLQSSASTYEFEVTDNIHLTAVFQPIVNNNEIEVTTGVGSVSLTWKADADATSYEVNIYADDAMTILIATYSVDTDGNVVRKAPASDGGKLTVSFDSLSEKGRYSYTVTGLDNNGLQLSQMAGTFEITEITGILNVSVVPAVDEVARYNMRGQRIQSAERGLNIIRMSDGTTRKVYVK